jgi:hypothetical protein
MTVRASGRSDPSINAGFRRLFQYFAPDRDEVHGRVWGAG